MCNLNSLLASLLIFSWLNLPIFVSLTRPVSVPSDALPARHSAVLSALERRDYSAVERELNALRSADADAFRINNYEYLLGRTAEKRGDLTAAIRSFTAVINQGSILSEYAHWHLAQIARRQKNLSLEREQLKRLLTNYPDSLLTESAKRRLADNQLESGDSAAALQFLRTRANRTNATGREALAQIGLIQLKLNQEQAARSIFDQLLQGSRDDYALLAAQKLDLLDSRARRALSETELLTRARVYAHNRDSAATRDTYLQLIDRFPASRARSEALYAIGRSYYIEYDYTNAIKWYDRVYQESPNTSLGELGFYHTGHSYQNLGRYQEAVQRYQQVIEKYPNGEWVKGAHLNAIDSLRSAGQFDAALEWCQRTINRFSNDVTGTTALFDQGKIYLIKGNYTLALEAFTRLRTYNLSRSAPGATNPAEAEFFRTYCLEKLGRNAEAIVAYLAFPVDRNSFYGNRATQRLKALTREAQAQSAINTRFKLYQENARRELAAGNYQAAKDAANQALRLTIDTKAEAELIEILRQCYNNLPAYNQFFNLSLSPAGRELLSAGSKTPTRSHQALADELIFLGLYDEGAPELRVGTISSIKLEGEEAEQFAAQESTQPFVNISQRRRASSSTNSNWQYSLAVYLNRGSHAHPAIHYGESRFSSIPRDFYLPLLPRDIAQLLYPAPYPDELTKEARKRNLDARFLLGIARQESRFNTIAKSGSAARGMFQFISSTADRISKELKLTEFDQNDLYQPAIAIEFAGQYMADLFSEFKDNPYAVAASYNGGEIAVRRWLERARSNECERFVSEIAYQETKDYVYKVMNNYWAYCQLYREDLTSH
ncbi:MAG: transglycosylase SLT domain-containing protein [Acidobacteriota bacterium]